MWAIRDKRSYDLMPGNDKKAMENQNNNNSPSETTTTSTTIVYFNNQLITNQSISSVQKNTPQTNHLQPRVVPPHTTCYLLRMGTRMTPINEETQIYPSSTTI